MKREEERLIPVRSESELRVGLLVVVGAGCPRCRRAHRGVLVSSAEVVRGLDDGQYIPCQHGAYGEVSTAWRFAPSLCWDVPAILCCGIAAGRIFRVDTGLDTTADAESLALVERMATRRADAIADRKERAR